MILHTIIIIIIISNTNTPIITCHMYYYGLLINAVFSVSNEIIEIFIVHMYVYIVNIGGNSFTMI